MELEGSLVIFNVFPPKIQACSSSIFSPIEDTHANCIDKLRNKKVIKSSKADNIMVWNHLNNTTKMMSWGAKDRNYPMALHKKKRKKT